MAKKEDDAPKKKAKKAEMDASDDAGDVTEDEIAKVEAEMAAAAAAEEKVEAAAEKESAEPESGAEDIDEDEIARVEAEMAAAAAAEEEAAAKAESGAEEPATEPLADTTEEDEIARVEAEMAAEVEGDAASSVHSTADSIRSGVAEEVFKPPTMPKGRPKQESLDPESDSDLGPMRDVEVEIRGVIFQKDATVGELAKIEIGSIMRGGSAEDSLLVQVGERKVAKGRAVVVDDRYGVIIDELVI